MKVLFVASELTPIAKVGGLGDVIGALPKALYKEGVKASIIIPLYSFISKKELQQVASRISIRLARKTEYITLYKTKLPGSQVPLFLIENKTYFSTGKGPYFEKSGFVGAKKEIQRFVFFSRAVYELIMQGILKPDVVHAHDWHAGALVAMLANKRQTTKDKQPGTLFTIHNLGNQGKWDAKEIDSWLTSRTAKHPFKKFGSNYNFIAEGIIYADKINTVSPTYAKEITTKKYGVGLEKLLQKRKKDLSGILNGIDYTFFNPQADTLIPYKFSPSNFQGKRKNKIALQKETGLPQVDVPLYGLVSRLTWQKGIDFITHNLADFLKTHDAQFIFLGSGEDALEKSLSRLAKMFPEKIYVYLGFNEKFAHRVYAASDFFLMPSRFEPCGLGQMIAMKYGTPPIVRATGGLKDSVKNLRTGFVFTSESPVAFIRIAREAYDIYTKKPKKFSQIQQTALKQNFDFSKSAKEYKKLYKQLR